MMTILVKPIDKHEEIQIVLKRYLEKIVLHFYKKQERKRAAPTTATIQENTGREILKSNGSMTVSKRGNIERRKRRRLPPHCPHHKTE